MANLLCQYSDSTSVKVISAAACLNLDSHADTEMLAYG